MSLWFYRQNVALWIPRGEGPAASGFCLRRVAFCGELLLPSTAWRDHTKATHSSQNKSIGNMRAAELRTVRALNIEFVCVESAKVSKPVVLGPGDEWIGEVNISVFDHE
eukprot:1184777-Prorocentrum_minimum.AAC.1